MAIQIAVARMIIEESVHRPTSIRQQIISAVIAMDANRGHGDCMRLGTKSELHVP